MADYHNLTDTLPFESQSPSGSTLNDDGYGELQNTAVFDDTVVLESPLNEISTQLENVCFDTEIVDDEDDLGNMEDVKDGPLLCEIETGIVLDSEDEGVCKTQSESFLDDNATGRTEKKAVDLQKRERQNPCLDAASIDKQFGAGKKGSFINIDRSDGKKDVPQLSICDHETGMLEYVSSPEPEESSQANALCFVDNFLTSNDVDMFQGVEERMSARKKSPLVSSAKGTQRLAKIIKQGSPVKQMGTFEWFESHQRGEADSFCERRRASFEFGDFRPRAGEGHQNLHKNEERGLNNEHEEKKESVDLHKDIRCPRHSHSSFVDHGLKVSVRTQQESERDLINGSVKELDKFMRTESTWKKVEDSDTARDIPDMFDVGISTQIAAEAMEALFYGPPPGCKAGDTCEGPEDFHIDLPEDETKSSTHLKQHSLESGDKAKHSIRRKRSGRSYNKEVPSSSWNCNYQELHHTIKPKPRKSKQSEVDAVSSNNLKKCVNCVSPSFPDQQALLRKQLSQEEPVVDQTRHCERARMKGTKDRPDTHRAMTNNVKEGNVLTYKRKRKRVVADPPKLLSGKQKCSELHSNASGQALDGKLSEQGEISPEEATITRFLSINPKGKRTHRKVLVNHSGVSKMHASFTSVVAEESNLHSARSQKMQEDDETTSNNFNMKGQKHSALSGLPLENNCNESSSGQNCNEQVTGIVTNSDSAVTITRMSASNLDRSKEIQTGKLDYMDSTLIINGLENNSFGISLKKSVESSGTECDTRVSCQEFNNILYIYHRRHCNKNQPKPSLLKELNGLGVPESISDLTRKGFRRRREVANVRVLFSQHLDDDILKRQEKISARLGISVTSCSMDATHFVADEFVRTKNMLEAIALGKPVVTHLWLDSCGQASCLLDEKNYILRDSKREKEIGFSMPISLARARQYPLLKDRRVCITQNVKPNKEMIASLVGAVGGEVVETSQMLAAKDQKIPDDLLILSCDKDLSICAPLLDKGATVYGSELLLSGIVIQKLDYERHRLFVKVVKVKRRISEGNRRSRRLSKR